MTRALRSLLPDLTIGVRAAIATLTAPQPAMVRLLEYARLVGRIAQ